MATFKAPEIPVLVEPVPAPLIAVSGIGQVTRLAGGAVCVTWYQEIPGLDRPEVERQVCLRFTIHESLLPQAHRILSAFMDDQPTQHFPRLAS